MKDLYKPSDISLTLQNMFEDKYKSINVASMFRGKKKKLFNRV